MKIFDSIPNEPHAVLTWTSSTAVGQIRCAVINTSNKFKCPLLREFWILNFSRRILKRIFVGSTANIRNECLFSGFVGNESEGQNQQIAWELLRDSRDLFFLRYDLAQWAKGHSFLKCIPILTAYTLALETKKIFFLNWCNIKHVWFYQKHSHNSTFTSTLFQFFFSLISWLIEYLMSH